MKKEYQCGVTEYPELKVIFISENPLQAIESMKRMMEFEGKFEYYAIDVKENKKYYEGF